MISSPVVQVPLQQALITAVLLDYGTLRVLFAARDKRNTSSEEVHRLRRQIKRSKESRRAIMELHDEAINRLERAKEVCSGAKGHNTTVL